jgi:hypothetical protein
LIEESTLVMVPVLSGKSQKGKSYMSTEDEVRQTSDQFHRVLSRMPTSDARPMVEVWFHQAQGGDDR